MTLGSLFDGSGGFPLAGLMNGITPVWASEIEPFPIRVTTKRIPFMKHYGDVSQISGADIEPVDIITFGSPCQDLSVAGKREGLDGNRSGLFRQAIRIIKEMREKTNGMYPTFAVWENVPGALSSGQEKGEDFRIVLESFCKIIDSNADVPRPEKWSNAGEILGDWYSIAWRILDAQYWGVPQRRRRIFLVADFAGERAGRILFESEGLFGNLTQSGTQRKRTATDTETGVDGTSGSSTYCLQGNGIERSDNAGCNGKGWSEETAYTLNTADRHSVVYDAIGNGEGNIAPTITGDHNNRITDYTALVTRSYSFYPQMKAESICFNEEIANTLVNGTNPGYQNGCLIKKSGAISTSKNDFHTKPSEECVDSLVATQYKDHPCVCYGTSLISGGLIKERAATFQAHNSLNVQNPIIETKMSEPHYIIRRLTPLECCRLQGFPDWWCSDLATEEPTEQELAFWRDVFDTYARINGTKPRSDKQIIKWLKNPHTDGAEYKMWGNGVALPCVDFVIGSIADVIRKGD